jgi:hypothetical protein
MPETLARMVRRVQAEAPERQETLVPQGTRETLDRTGLRETAARVGLQETQEILAGQETPDPTVRRVPAEAGVLPVILVEPVTPETRETTVLPVTVGLGELVGLGVRPARTQETPEEDLPEVQERTLEPRERLWEAVQAETPLTELPAAPEAPGPWLPCTVPAAGAVEAREILETREALVPVVRSETWVPTEPERRPAPVLRQTGQERTVRVETQETPGLQEAERLTVREEILEAPDPEETQATLVQQEPVPDPVAPLPTRGPVRPGQTVPTEPEPHRETPEILVLQATHRRSETSRRFQALRVVPVETAERQPTVLRVPQETQEPQETPATPAATAPPDQEVRQDLQETQETPEVLETLALTVLPVTVGLPGLQETQATPVVQETRETTAREVLAVTAVEPETLATQETLAASVVQAVVAVARTTVSILLPARAARQETDRAVVLEVTETRRLVQELQEVPERLETRDRTVPERLEETLDPEGTPVRTAIQEVRVLPGPERLTGDPAIQEVRVPQGTPVPEGIQEPVPTQAVPHQTRGLVPQAPEETPVTRDPEGPERLRETPVPPIQETPEDRRPRPLRTLSRSPSRRTRPFPSRSGRAARPGRSR